MQNSSKKYWYLVVPRLKKLNRLCGHRRLAQSPLWAGPDVSQAAYEGALLTQGSIFCDLDDLGAIGGGGNRLTLPVFVSLRPSTAIARDLVDLSAVGRGSRNRLTWPPQTGWRRLYLPRVSHVDKPPHLFKNGPITMWHRCQSGHSWLHLPRHSSAPSWLSWWNGAKECLNPLTPEISSHW